MQIRRVQADEGLQLRELRLRALADASEAFGSTLAEMQAQPPSWWHERAKRASQGGEQCLFIALESQRWLGMAGAFIVTDRLELAEVVSMWVDPSVRRRGVAQELLNAVNAWATKHSAAQMRLWVTQTNAPAVALYRRIGFEPTGKVQPHPAYPGLSEMEMARPCRLRLRP